jgi:large repetitive protein
VVRLSWSPADDNGAALNGYTVTAHAGGSATTKRVSAGTTSLNWAGLQKSTAYSFSVVATNSKGDSPSSGRSATVTPYGLPGAVSGLTTSPTGTGRTLRYSFSGAASNGSPVTYQYSTGGSWASLGTATSGTITVPANGTSYQLTVRALNRAGTGSSRTVATPAAYGPLNMPTIQATANEGTVTFSWSPASASTIGNGRPVTVKAVVNNQVVDNDGEYTTDQYRKARDFAMRLEVCVTGTSTCDSVTKSATSKPMPAPSAAVRLAGDASAVGYCAGTDAEENGYTNCRYTHLSVENLEPNSQHTLECVGTMAPGAPGFSGGETVVWNETTFRVDSSGSFEKVSGACIVNDRLSAAHLRIDGSLRTNTIRAPW